jgi:hypothetical protein
MSSRIPVRFGVLFFKFIFLLSAATLFATVVAYRNVIADSVPENSDVKSGAVRPSTTPTPPIPHTLVGSYYTLENNINAKLLLNNKGSAQLEVQPTLYNAQGQEISIPSVTVEPQSFRFIDLSEWAALGGESFRSGNIKLFHYGKDLVLGAQIYLTDDARSLSFEEKLTELGKFNSQRQEAVWWMPSNQADVRVVLTNTGNTSLTVTGTLAKKPNHTSPPRVMTIAPHSTKAFDLRDEFLGSNSFLNSDVVALSLEHTGAADALLSRVLVYETNEGYSNVVQFSNPVGGKSSEYQGVGFQIENIGSQQFNPVIVARNVGNDAATVTAKVPYTRSNGTKSNITLPALQLSSGEMRTFNVQSIVQRVAQENIKVASIEVEYSSAPGSVIVASHSYTDDHDQVFRVPMWDPLGQRSPTGGYPWRIEGTSATQTYIKNITDQEEDYVAFLVWENGGMYMIGLKTLAAHETVNIDVKKLRNQQIPDEKGRIIPLNVSSGQLQWTLRRKDDLPEEDTRANLALIGRSEQVDIAKGITNNYSCQNCCAGTHVGGFIFPASQEIEYGESAHFASIAIEETCYSYPFEFTISTNSWTSSNSGMGSISYGDITPSTAGVSSIGASWSAHYSISYPCGPGGEDPFGIRPVFDKPNECDWTGRKSGPSDSTNESEAAPNNSRYIPGCGTCWMHSFLFTPVAATLTVNPRVQKIQYQEPGSSNYVDVNGTLYVLKGTTVQFKAMPNPSDSTFPNGKPVWSGTSGAVGTGQTISVTFNAVSTTRSDYKTVVATSGNSVTANVIVYELTGTFTPQDNFTGRSLIRFGLQEIVDLSVTISPSMRVSNLGRVRWSRQTGTGQLVTSTTDDGTGTFTAPEIAEISTLHIDILDGPSKGQYVRVDISIVAPTLATEIQKPGSGIHHTNGYWGLGFLGWIRFDPTDVSFAKLKFKELSTTAIASGYLSAFSGYPHSPYPLSVDIGDCNIVRGCRVLADDEVISEFIPYPNIPFSTGDFLWPIPWEFYTTNRSYSVGIGNHHIISNAAGDATLRKAGAGPFTKNYNDPTTNW